MACSILYSHRDVASLLRDDALGRLRDKGSTRIEVFDTALVRFQKIAAAVNQEICAMRMRRQNMERPNQAPTATTIARRPGFLRDIYNGAVLGDFAGELGLAGIFTRIILGYVPAVGMICAARDYIADR